MDAPLRWARAACEDPSDVRLMLVVCGAGGPARLGCLLNGTFRNGGTMGSRPSPIRRQARCAAA